MMMILNEKNDCLNLCWTLSPTEEKYFHAGGWQITKTAMGWTARWPSSLSVAYLDLQRLCDARTQQIFSIVNYDIYVSQMVSGYRYWMRNITPWSPYSGRPVLSSAGRISLTSAFADFVKVRLDIDAFELPAIFDAPIDEAENDACRDLVRLQAEHMAAAFVVGRLATMARPLEGGSVVEIDPSLWEIDDPLLRFATGAFNLDHWAAPFAEPTHRLFVESMAFDCWLAAQRPSGVLTSQQICELQNPQQRAVRTLQRLNAEATQPTPAVGPATEPYNALTPQAPLPELLNVHQVIDLTTLKRSTIYAYKAKGRFPENFALGGTTKRWFKAEVLEWIAERAARRAG